MPKSIYINAAAYAEEAGIVLSGGTGSGVYDTNLSSDLEIPTSVGGYGAGTSVADISGRTFTQMWDDLLFPTILASIGLNATATINGINTQTLEVGTSLAPVSTGVFNPGFIRNGDNSTGPNLKGDATEFRFKLPNGTLDYTDSSPASNSIDHTFTSYNIIFGTNRWEVEIDYAAGSGVYYDNKGNPVTNLDGSRNSGTIEDLSNIVSGRRYMWYGMGVQGSAPVNSTGVRDLTNFTFLGTSNNITNFDISIPASTQEVYFYIPAGKTVSVTLVESNANVTGSFDITTIDVNDASGTIQGYEKWVHFIGTVGYPSTVTYRITIS